MELELKHLKGYLDYGLQCLNQHLPDVDLVIEELKGIDNVITWCGRFDAKHGSNYIPICGIKPLLHPLSSLTKEIEHDGERFVPLLKLFPDKCLLGNAINKSEKIELLIEKTEGGLSADYKVEINDICYFRYSTIKGINVGNFFTKRGQYIINNFYLYEKLYKWHFNVHNLPDHLFIDKSTVNLKG